MNIGDWKPKKSVEIESLDDTSILRFVPVGRQSIGSDEMLFAPMFCVHPFLEDFSNRPGERTASLARVGDNYVLSYYDPLPRDVIEDQGDAGYDRATILDSFLKRQGFVFFGTVPLYFKPYKFSLPRRPKKSVLMLRDILENEPHPDGMIDMVVVTSPGYARLSRLVIPYGMNVYVRTRSYAVN